MTDTPLPRQRKQIQLPFTSGSAEAELRREIHNYASTRSGYRMGVAPHCIDNSWFNALREAFRQELVDAYYAGIEKCKQTHDAEK